LVQNREPAATSCIVRFTQVRPSRSVLTNVVAAPLWGRLHRSQPGVPNGAQRRGYSVWRLRDGFHEQGVQPCHSPIFLRFPFFFLAFFTSFFWRCCWDLGVACGVGVGTPLTNAC